LHFAASEIEEDEDKQEEEDEHIVQDIVQHVEAEKRKPEMAVQPQKKTKTVPPQKKTKTVQPVKPSVQPEKGKPDISMSSTRLCPQIDENDIKVEANDAEIVASSPPTPMKTPAGRNRPTRAAPRVAGSQSAGCSQTGAAPPVVGSQSTGGLLFLDRQPLYLRLMYLQVCSIQIHILQLKPLQGFFDCDNISLPSFHPHQGQKDEKKEDDHEELGTKEPRKQRQRKNNILLERKDSLRTRKNSCSRMWTPIFDVMLNQIIRFS